jgi:hypothetical protein
MRVWARGPSGMFTASTPASLSSLIDSSVDLASQPFGGSTSTEVTNSPRATFRDHFDRSSGGITVTSCGLSSETRAAPVFAKTFACRGLIERMASAISLM